MKVKKTAFKITKSPMEITYKKHGTTIYFSGSDGIDDTKGIIDEDKPIKLVILDELTEFFDDGEGEDELTNIEATFVRGNSSGFQMLYLFNPQKNPNAEINQWCKKMEKREDCIHIHTTYKDVPIEWLGRDLIDSAEEMEKTDPKMYRWVWLGESTGIDDAVYYMFNQSHIKETKEGQRFSIIGIGGDYGQQNATTFQAAGLDMGNKQLKGLDEYYHSGRECGRQKSPSEYAQDFVQFVTSLGERYGTENVHFYLFLDPSAQGLQEEIKRACRGANVPVSIRNAENDVKLGISRVQKMLALHLMSISSSQEWAMNEFQTYEYDKDSIKKGKEEPVKIDDHCMDAIRYLVMGMWTKIKPWLPVLERED